MARGEDYVNINTVQQDSEDEDYDETFTGGTVYANQQECYSPPARPDRRQGQHMSLSEPPRHPPELRPKAGATLPAKTKPSDAARYFEVLAASASDSDGADYETPAMSHRSRYNAITGRFKPGDKDAEQSRSPAGVSALRNKLQGKLDITSDSKPMGTKPAQPNPSRNRYESTPLPGLKSPKKEQDDKPPAFQAPRPPQREVRMRPKPKQPSTSSDSGLASGCDTDPPISKGLPATGPISGQRPAVSRPLRKQSERPSTASQRELEQFSWYVGNMKREDAESKVRNYRQDGAFVVRESATGGIQKPYTMTILFKNDIYHLHVRRREKDGLYAVGFQKPDELVFDSLQDVIKHFHNNAIELISNHDTKRQSNPEGRVKLRYRK